MEKETKIVEGGFERPTFLVAIPTLGTIPIEFMLAFSRLAMPQNCTASTMIVTKTEIGVARNAVAEAALNMKPRPKYIFFFGDDMIPGYDALMKLWFSMEEDQTIDVLSALYHLKQDYPIPLAWRNDVQGYLEPFKNYQPGEIVDVDVAGMDFTLIRTEVFEKIKQPWFKTGPTTPKEWEDSFGKDALKGLQEYYNHTEDVFFIKKCKQAGLKIGVHTDVRVGHLYIKTGEVY